MDKENAIENSPLAVRKAPTKTAALGKPKAPQFQSPMVRAIIAWCTKSNDLFRKLRWLRE
jgi:hypothetical protein